MKRSIDNSGSPIGVVRMDPQRAYIGVPELLMSFINESNAAAWSEIKEKIDYIYSNLDYCLSRLNREIDFEKQIKSQIQIGKKLLFKPNLVNPRVIEPETHGEGMGNSACTQWPFIAALMRWFHDKLEITYHEMAVGEAASATSITAGAFNLLNAEKEPITTEAVIEGRSGEFYGGWGFYFVRKYLSEKHPSSHQDDPMKGYEESISGHYLPPGKAGMRLMVYDLNRLYDDKSKPRTVPVANGANFKEITLHKVIVGGDPQNREDMQEYPGCFLINVPKLKMHAIDLITNAIKNLGIGLYPMEVSQDDDQNSTRWKYAFPYNQYPGMKTEIPHAIWVADIDDKSGLPIRDNNGRYIVTNTAGMSGTQADVITATADQGVSIFHIVDAIEVTNIDHTGGIRAVKVPEGYALASSDPVALDLLCARYCFNTETIQDTEKLKEEYSLSTRFIQKVPVPMSDGQNIIETDGFDSPLSRYDLFKYAEGRGLGQQSYYVVGFDSISGADVASSDGYLGIAREGNFSELITPYFYYNPSTILWDMQQTVFGYLKANDNLTGSSYYQEILDAFDENGDGIIDYDEHGKNGFWTPLLRLGAEAMSQTALNQYGFLHGPFLQISFQLKYSNSQWNKQGHDFLKSIRIISACAAALAMSKLDIQNHDSLYPDMTWGKGKWPSLQFTNYISTCMAIYGLEFPAKVSLLSLYGRAFQYADKTLNGGIYTGRIDVGSSLDAIDNYFKAIAAGSNYLDFSLYVPKGYGYQAGVAVPNVKETEDPARIFTATFNNESETWQWET